MSVYTKLSPALGYDLSTSAVRASPRPDTMLSIWNEIVLTSRYPVLIRKYPTSNPIAPIHPYHLKNFLYLVSIILFSSRDTTHSFNNCFIVHLVMFPEFI